MIEVREADPDEVALVSGRRRRLDETVAAEVEYEVRYAADAATKDVETARSDLSELVQVSLDDGSFTATLVAAAEVAADDASSSSEQAEADDALDAARSTTEGSVATIVTTTSAPTPEGYSASSGGGGGGGGDSNAAGVDTMLLGIVAVAALLLVGIAVGYYVRGVPKQPALPLKTPVRDPTNFMKENPMSRTRKL